MEELGGGRQNHGPGPSGPGQRSGREVGRLLSDQAQLGQGDFAHASTAVWEKHGNGSQSLAPGYQLHPGLKVGGREVVSETTLQVN